MTIALGIIGVVIISYAIWLKDEKRQNVSFIIGGAFLLAYSAIVGDVIFIALQVIFIASAFLELVKMKRK